MLEEHVIKIRNGCTLAEMAKISLPNNRHDPISQQMMPNFYISSNNPSRSHRSKAPSIKENLKTNETKVLPANHYIEDRFYAYSKAKLQNKPLFSDLSKQSALNCEGFSKRSSSNSKFHTSKYPNVPLTKEMSMKVETVNNFREADKKSFKRISTTRPFSCISVSRKSFNSNKILLNLKSWDRIKKEKSGNFKVESVMEMAKPSELEEKKQPRPKSESAKRNMNVKNSRIEMVNTIESASTLLSPMAPVYAASRMVPQSPNLVMYPYARYGHLFE